MTTTISGSNGIVFPDATSMQTGQQAVKAWVNFDGDGTVSIRAGYNVASITDIQTGNYRVNFTTPMTDANFSVSGNSNPNGFAGAYAGFNTLQTNSVEVEVRTNANAFIDSNIVLVAVFN